MVLSNPNHWENAGAGSGYGSLSDRKDVGFASLSSREGRLNGSAAVSTIHSSVASFGPSTAPCAHGTGRIDDIQVSALSCKPDSADSCIHIEHVSTLNFALGNCVRRSLTSCSVDECSLFIGSSIDFWLLQVFLQSPYRESRRWTMYRIHGSQLMNYSKCRICTPELWSKHFLDPPSDFSHPCRLLKLLSTPMEPNRSCTRYACDPSFAVGIPFQEIQ